MKMLRNDIRSLRSALGVSGASSFLFGLEEAGRCWSALLTGSVLADRGNEFVGRSVLIAVSSQFSAAAALVELDGVARRIVLYPPDLSLEHIDFAIACAGVEIILSDRMSSSLDRVACVQPSRWTKGSATTASKQQLETEWVLLTSGTTGRPKLVVHTLASLTGAIDTGRRQAGAVVWSTFYDIRRYGGLQILLRAAVTGTSMVLSSTQESTVDFLVRAASHRVTHISGTPSHWRRALMSPAAHLIAPEYVRLSGEIADQGILNQLRAVYPQAKICHAFATTEAGVAFDVNDGLAGFPANVLESTAEVEMKIENRSLRIRSHRTAGCYLGGHAGALRDAEGFVNTGDVVERRGDRYHFVGRGDGMINVGGMKVYAEEVEAVINGHPKVEVSLVRTRKNPITGALVVADVVLKSAPDAASNEVRIDILRLCRETLAPYKVPASINFVPALAVAETGKLSRLHA
jgi:acyl-coenzyme A synthetase/AMP-(fatty) acid ligase